MRNTVMTHKGFKRLRAWLMLVVLALPLTLTAPIAHADDFIDGWRAYSEGDYDKVLSKWLPLAEQGHVLAQLDLAWMYYHGEGVERDLKEAARLYRLAAEQGVASAQNNLGVMYKNGEGVFPDKKEAARLYRLAAEQGVASAQYNLG
jgi:TPR repeat protein